jgi:hypothetical protein
MNTDYNFLPNKMKIRSGKNHTKENLEILLGIKTGSAKNSLVSLKEIILIEKILMTSTAMCSF